MHLCTHIWAVGMLRVEVPSWSNAGLHIDCTKLACNANMYDFSDGPILKVEISAISILLCPVLTKVVAHPIGIRTGVIRVSDCQWCCCYRSRGRWVSMGPFCKICITALKSLIGLINLIRPGPSQINLTFRPRQCATLEPSPSLFFSDKPDSS